MKKGKKKETINKLLPALYVEPEPELDEKVFYGEVKNKGGRPLLWTEEKSMELADELIEWLCPEILIISDGRGIDKNLQNVFFEEFLYSHRRMHPGRIAELSKRYERFAEAMDFARKLQELKIVKLAAFKKLQPQVAALILSTQHKYMERRQIGEDQENPFGSGGIQFIQDPIEK